MAIFKPEIKLGNKVRDIYTGFEGTATGRTTWLYGCNRICIEPTTLDKDGKTMDAVWFDEQRVELVKSQPIKMSASNTATSGGPQNDPTR